jgi:hypothetical protein
VPDAVQYEEMTSEMREAVLTIRRFLRGEGSGWEWKDFLSIPASDPAVLRLQELCIDLPFQYPPEEKDEYCGPDGLERLRGIVEDLDEARGD